MLFDYVPVFILAGLLWLSPASNKTVCSKLSTLQTKLSAAATIECGVQDVRWSDYAAPQPGAIITPGSEGDIATIVAFASKKNIPFLLQGGGHGWSDTFRLGSSGIVIDTSQLKTVSFNADGNNATFQAGVTVGDLVSAAWENNARVMTGTCNCVGLLGASLGGGLGRTQGLYGMGADQLLAVNYVDGNGRSYAVTPGDNPELWWALAGAGPNFGIVTSAVYKAYPVPQADNTAWYGSLSYNTSQIEAVVSAIDDLTIEPEMHVDLLYAGGMVLVMPFYLGSEETGREKFASLLALGPLADWTGIVPYISWNDGSDSICLEGGRKPTYSANLQTLEPAAWRSIWNEFIAFLDEYPEANASSILTECYSTVKAVEIGSSQSSFPWRDRKCYSMVIPWYTDPSLDDAANVFGRKIRSVWDASSGISGSEVPLRVFDWGALGPDVVVADLGGGDGTSAVALADRHRGLKRIIVQDVPAIVEKAGPGIPGHLRRVRLDTYIVQLNKRYVDECLERKELKKYIGGKLLCSVFIITGIKVARGGTRTLREPPE